MLIPRRHPEFDCVFSDDPFVIEVRDARDELRADGSTPDRREGVLAKGRCRGKNGRVSERS
jgi:hypothetical protein